MFVSNVHKSDDKQKKPGRDFHVRFLRYCSLKIVAQEYHDD